MRGRTAGGGVPVSLPSCVAGIDGRPVGVGCDSEWLCPDLRAVTSDTVSELAPPRVGVPALTDGPTGGSSLPAVQAGNRTGYPAGLPGLLLARFPGSQKKRAAPAGNQPTPLECPPPLPPFQNGDSGRHFGGHPTGRLGDVCGPHRRLLSHSDSTLVPQISAVRGGRIGFPVPSPSVWAVAGTAGLFSAARPPGSSPPCPRDPFPPLSRRPAHLGTVVRPLSAVDGDPFALAVQTGLGGEPSKVRFNSSPGLCVRGGALPNAGRGVPAPARSCEVGPRSYPSPPPTPGSFGQIMALAPRDTELPREIGTPRSPPHPPCSLLPPLAVCDRGPLSRSPGGAGCCSRDSTAMVASIPALGRPEPHWADSNPT